MSHRCRFPISLAKSLKARSNISSAKKSHTERYRLDPVPRGARKPDVTIEFIHGRCVNFVATNSPRGTLLSRFTFSFAADRNSHADRYGKNRSLHFDCCNRRSPLSRASLVVWPCARADFPDRHVPGAVLSAFLSRGHVFPLAQPRCELSQSSSLRCADQFSPLPAFCVVGPAVQCADRSRRA